jgi:hypothetical protein
VVVEISNPSSVISTISSACRVAVNFDLADSLETMTVVPLAQLNVSSGLGLVEGLVDGEVEGLADAELDGLVERLVDGEAEGLAETLPDGELDCEADGVCEGEDDSEDDGVEETLLDLEWDGDVEGEMDGEWDGEAEAECDGEDDGDEDNELEGERDGEAETDPLVLLLGLVEGEVEGTATRLYCPNIEARSALSNPPSGVNIPSSKADSRLASVSIITSICHE